MGVPHVRPESLENAHLGQRCDPVSGRRVRIEEQTLQLHEREQAESGQVLLAFDKQEPDAAEAPLVALPTRSAS